MTEKLLTIDDLVESLEVSRSWVYRQAQKDDSTGIPRHYVGDYVYFDIDDLLEWLEMKFENQLESRNRGDYPKFGVYHVDNQRDHGEYLEELLPKTSCPSDATEVEDLNFVPV